MIGPLGYWEILIIVLIIILLFGGAKKLPELAQGLGKGIREFKKAAKGESEKAKLEEKKEDED